MSHGYEDLPSGIQDTTTTTHGNTTPHHTNADEIPELEDWDNGQFNDAESTLIKHHNAPPESKCIRKKYTQKLLDLMDNQYYEEDSLATNYNTLVLTLTITISHQEGYKSHPMIQMAITPLLPDQADVQHWHMWSRGRRALLHGHRLYRERTRSAESRKARKRQQNYKQMI